MTGNFFSQWIYWAPFVLQLLFLCVCILLVASALLQPRHLLLPDDSTLHTNTTTVYLSEKTCSTLNLRSVPPFDWNIRALFHSHQSFVWEWVNDVGRSICVCSLYSHTGTQMKENKAKRMQKKRKVLCAEICVHFFVFTCRIFWEFDFLWLLTSWVWVYARRRTLAKNNCPTKSMRTIFGMQCFILWHLSMLSLHHHIVYRWKTNEHKVDGTQFAWHPFDQRWSAQNWLPL